MIQREPAVSPRDDRPRDLVVTYCSREKDPSTEPMPASRRYLSSRIRSAGAAAKQVGAAFAILSGKFGLITAEREIPDYDHVLTAAAVAGHAGILERQLRRYQARRVVFVVRAAGVDPGAAPYERAMRLACGRCGVVFTVLEIGARTPSPRELAAGILRQHDGQPLPEQPARDRLRDQ